LSRSLKVILLVLVLAPGLHQAAAQAEFDLLQVPERADLASFSLSHDGRDMGCLLNGSVYWWSAADGFRFLFDGALPSSGVGMSAGGKALAAGRTTDRGSLATIWYAGGASLVLEPLLKGCPQEGPVSTGFDLSADGSVVVGMTANCRDHLGFRWSRKGGLADLDTPAGFGSEARAVSGDGLTTAGFLIAEQTGDPRAAIWREGRPAQLILGQERPSQALNISPSGRFVVGQADPDSPGARGFVWSEGQAPRFLDSLSGLPTDPTRAVAVSDNGIVVGSSGDPIFGNQEAVIWTPAEGLQALASVLDRARARVPDGLELTECLDISGDGTTIVGTCRTPDYRQGIWRVRLQGGALLGVASPAGPPPVATSAGPADSLEFDQADMLLPFPFGKRGRTQLPRP
jgi:hypothetical protein